MKSFINFFSLAKAKVMNTNIYLIWQKIYNKANENDFHERETYKSLSVDFRLKIYTHKSDVKVLLMLMKMNMNKSLARFGKFSLWQIWRKLNIIAIFHTRIEIFYSILEKRCLYRHFIRYTVQSFVACMRDYRRRYLLNSHLHLSYMLDSNV